MTTYPLTLKVCKADFSQPEPSSTVEEHIVDGRRTDDGDSFVIIDPYNGNELEVYSSLEDGSQTHDTSSFYWVDEVLSDG